MNEAWTPKYRRAVRQRVWIALIVTTTVFALMLMHMLGARPMLWISW